MASDWTRPFDASYEYVRISRETGRELEVLRRLRNGGEITRNANTAVYESASADFAEAFDIGTDRLGIYLDAEFTDGSTERERLGTFIPAVDSVDVTASLREGTVKAYGLLKVLQDDDFDGPYVIPAGTNLVGAARKICEDCGLEVVADECGLVLAYDIVFGVGRDNDAGSKLEAVNILLAAAGFRAAQTDRWGRVLMRRYADPSAMAVSRTLREGPGARFLPQVEDSTDRGEVANVVIVDFATQDASVRGSAVDDSPSSPLSTVAAGRRIVKSYSYDSLPGVSTEDPNILEGAGAMAIGTGAREDKSFRQSDGNGSISTLYVPDSPQNGAMFGIKIVSNGGRIGFCQDKGPSVKKETDYTQSVWVKGTAGKTVQLQIFWDQERSLGSGLHEVAMTGEWQKVTATYHALESHTNVSWGYVYLKAGGEAVVVADKVEEGAEATAWPQDAMQAAADARARELLDTERSVKRGLTFETVYIPVEPPDLVRMEYASGGVAGDYSVQKQRIKLGCGCKIRHEARRFER